MLPGECIVLKKIGVSDLRRGMFVQEFCGSWMDHPFWKRALLIRSAEELKKVLESGVTEVWIDTAKGADVPVERLRAATSVAEVDQLVDASLAEAEQASPPVVRKVDVSEEIDRAARICANGKQAVMSMFQEVRMGKAINAEAAGELVEEISNSVMRNPGALISLARLKSVDDYTYMHSVAVCALMVSLARQLKQDDATVRELGMAGLLHDMGKANMPMEVLNKPGKLTDEEFAIMKGHPAEGHRILMASGSVGEIPLEVCLHHHEKIDGTGYPDRLSGDQISLFAKMGAVCDVYDAITSNRPYKIGWDPAESIRKMTEWSAGHFDARVFQAFVRSVGIYPVGSLVRLESGRLGIIIEQSERLLTPIVKVFFSIRSQTYIPPEIIDLSSPRALDKIASREDPERWGMQSIDRFLHGNSA